MPNFSIPLSGLTAESTALSAIANNLSNQNTTGYKDTSVLFSDLFYQNLGTTGSGDPIQVGAGTKIGAMPSLFTQGSVSSTGVPTDVAIQGSGFFAVQGSDGVVSYTRAGDFSELNNYLVTSSGQQVLGYPATNGVVNTGAGLAPLQLGGGTISPPTQTGNVQLTVNLNASSLPTDTPYSTPIQIYDSLGAIHNLTATFTNTGANTWDYSLSIPATDLSGAGATGVLATGTLTFNGNGVLTGDTATTGGTVTGALSDVTGIPITGLADGASDMTFNWNVLNGTTPVLTQVAAANSTTSLHQDGSSSGSLASFSIGSDGTITGSFSNGKVQALGEIALASFSNNNGLQLQGDTDFTPTLASGQAVVGTPGAGGLGTLSGGSLELSNVDIATEFANLIVAQRGFEADAKVVTTFDQITIGETCFFRNQPQLDALRQIVIPKVLEAKAKLPLRRLRIWSAGCSTGEEPYTLSMLLLEEAQRRLKDWTIEILATDLNERSLAHAKTAIYGAYSTRNLTAYYRQKCFRPAAEQLQVEECVRKNITFSRLNLSDDSRMIFMKSLDVVFCCNVLIYFDLSSKRRVIQHFYNNLLPHGYLFLGHSESLYGVTDDFRLVHLPGATAYTKGERSPSGKQGS